MSAPEIIIPEHIERQIFLIRGERVILDTDLASIYGVSTKALLQAVKRNSTRFPEDFLFPLTRKETKELLSSMKGKDTWGGRRSLPRAFTEHGAVMAANVLRSERAVHASIFVVRAFVRLRRLIAAHKELSDRIDELEQTISTHDKAIVSLFDAIRKIMAPPTAKQTRIGFGRDDRIGNRKPILGIREPRTRKVATNFITLLISTLQSEELQHLTPTQDIPRGSTISPSCLLSKLGPFFLFYFPSKCFLK